MSFRINTNVSAMNAHTSSVANNRNLSGSLAKLSSGLRINTAADDASGMAIADSLRSQASALGQAINNANDAISMAQIADKAMDEQLKILDTIKVKATQAAQDGQNANSRKALQADIKRLTEQLDNIASQTTFNGKSLLAGSFTNAQFQVGAYSNQTVSMSIGATSSDKIGHTRFETAGDGAAAGTGLSAGGTSQLTFTMANGAAITLESVVIGTSAGTGIGALAEVINKNSDLLGGVSASWSLTATGGSAISAATLTNVAINGVTIATSLEVEANDRSGVLVDAINTHKETTGVVASVDAEGKLQLTSTDGRGIETAGLEDAAYIDNGTYFGRLTLIRAGAAGIEVEDTGDNIFSMDAAHRKVASVSLRDMMGGIDNETAEAMGAFTSGNAIGADKDLGAGVTTYAGAQAMMKIAQSAQEKLDTIRADIGSAQNQLVATVNNISVTQVNVKAAESQIRDVDFAAESANFSKFNILAQSGSYAMSQANAVQQNVLRLLQ